MKPKFILFLIAIVMGASAFSQETGKLEISAGNIKHLAVEGGLQVILMPASNSENFFSMDQRTGESLDVKLSGHTLSIAPVSSTKGQVTVYLRVGALESLTVASNTEVKTTGVLKTAMLDVYIDADAMAHLRTNGKVKAHSLAFGEIKVKDVSGNWLAKK